jgi:hypothetical protein
MQDVADILKESSVANLQTYWDRNCVRAMNKAYADLSSILLGKGYTIEQLDQWDYRADYSRQQALFWLFTETSLGMGYDFAAIDKLDHRAELREGATILIGGIPVAPGGSDTGGIGGGCISEEGYRITGSTEF